MKYVMTKSPANEWRKLKGLIIKAMLSNAAINKTGIRSVDKCLGDTDKALNKALSLISNLKKEV